MTVKSRLLTGENTVRLRGNPPFFSEDGGLRMVRRSHPPSSISYPRFPKSIRAEITIILRFERRVCRWESCRMRQPYWRRPRLLPHFAKCGSKFIGDFNICTRRQAGFACRMGRMVCKLESGRVCWLHRAGCLTSTLCKVWKWVRSTISNLVCAAVRSRFAAANSRLVTASPAG